MHQTLVSGSGTAGSNRNLTVPSFCPNPSDASSTVSSFPSVHGNGAPEPGRRSRRWIFSSVSVCGDQKLGMRNAMFKLDVDEDDCDGPPDSFGDTGEGEEMKAGSETGMAKIVPYKSRSACAMSARQVHTCLKYHHRLTVNLSPCRRVPLLPCTRPSKLKRYSGRVVNGCRRIRGVGVDLFA